MFPLAGCQEIRAAFFVFFDPLPGETPVADLGKDSAHLFACLGSDDARPGGIIALLGGIADGIAHVAESAPVYEIDDQFQFVETFEVRDFRLIAGGDKRLKACLDQFAQPTL